MKTTFRMENKDFSHQLKLTAGGKEYYFNDELTIEYDECETLEAELELIHALGHRLQALHIHDNDKWKDSHQLPFTMSIDFLPIVKALKEIGYAGYFTLEVDYYWPDFTADDAQKRMNDLYASVKKLVDMYETA